MRVALLALTAIGSFAAIGMSPAQARTVYPFCLQTMYGDNDCTYSTYQACAAAGSGLGSSCIGNPAMPYVAAPGYAEPPPPPRGTRPRGY